MEPEIDVVCTLSKYSKSWPMPLHKCIIFAQNYSYCSHDTEKSTDGRQQQNLTMTYAADAEERMMSSILDLCLEVTAI